MKKRGIALLITLVVIALLGEIVYLSLSFLDKSKKSSHSVENLIQVNLIADDLVKILKNTLKDINSSSELSFIYNKPIEIELKKQKASVSILLKPSSCVININSLVKPNGELDEIYERVWVGISNKYEIRDPSILTNILVDNIKKREFYNKKFLFVDGNITNIKHFNQILESYFDKSGDNRIFNIPWEEFIGFENRKIDFNFISPFLLVFMEDMIDIDQAVEILNQTTFYKKLEDINLDKDIIERLKKYPFSFFVPRFKCSAVYRKSDTQIEFEFIFDKKRGVSNFEILGKI